MPVPGVENPMDEKKTWTPQSNWEGTKLRTHGKIHLLTKKKRSHMSLICKPRRARSCYICDERSFFGILIP